MNKLYRKLAFINIKNSKQFYLPYLLAGMISVMMYYSMRAMQGNEGIAAMRGGAFMVEILKMGSGVVAIFVSIFLFYTNSFIMKRRKKELGVYNILGMEKKHMAKVLFWESLFTFFVILCGGLFGGILFNKLLTMLLYRLSGLEESIPFYVSKAGCVNTAVLFGVICLAALVFNFMQVRIANPVELLRSTNTGEREPKTKALMAIVGVICLGIGYGISFVTENPIAAIPLFFVAVVLVVIGTYCIFTAGSIALLKLLRSNKKYYYQTKHFTTVSGMIYRMKQNAVGLANICILSTMVLVMVSTTISTYAGLEDELNYRCSRELDVSFSFDQIPGRETADKMSEAFENGIRACGRQIGDKSALINVSVMTLRTEEGRYDIVSDDDFVDYSDVTMIAVMTKGDYESYRNITLADLKEGEVFLASRPRLGLSDITVNNITYHVAEEMDIPESESVIEGLLAGTIYLVVKDDVQLQHTYEGMKEKWESAQHRLPLQAEYQISVDIDGTAEEKMACLAQIRQDINTWQQDGVSRIGEPFAGFHVESREEDRESFLQTNGGLLFLGMFLGTMFLMETVLIIYYKQISEGYGDKERYAIMKRVGMSNAEVKASINSQVKTVFFLPLVMAVIHLSAAFPMLKRLLALLNLSNVALFVWCMVGTIIVFALIYLLVFVLTSKSYYKIVGDQA